MSRGFVYPENINEFLDEFVTVYRGLSSDSSEEEYIGKLGKTKKSMFYLYQIIVPNEMLGGKLILQEFDMLYDAADEPIGVIYPIVGASVEARSR